jgi:hypothetical protein
MHITGGGPQKQDMPQPASQLNRYVPAVHTAQSLHHVTQASSGGLVSAKHLALRCAVTHTAEPTVTVDSDHSTCCFISSHNTHLTDFLGSSIACSCVHVLT